MFPVAIMGSVVSRLLQSLEFFRSGFGRYFSLAWEKIAWSKFFILPFVIIGFIRLSISLFGRFVSFIHDTLVGMGINQVFVVGGVDILALANTVLPLDEMIALFIMWFSVYAACASIRFVRAAWSAIPLKAT